MYVSSWTHECFWIADTLLHSGKYSSVYMAHRPIRSRAVAVKIYRSAHQKYFDNERDIYMLPHMRHENVLAFIGSQTEFEADGSCAHQLLVAYMPHGSLHAFLKAQSINWAVFMRMGRAITAGLTHLHMEVEKNGE